MALLRRDETDRAVAVLVVVPVDEARDPRARLLDGRFGHEGAAIGNELDITVGGELAKRLPHRRPADADFEGYVLLAQVEVWRKVSLQYPRAAK